MKIVFLDVKTIGEDIDLSYFDKFVSSYCIKKIVKEKTKLEILREELLLISPDAQIKYLACDLSNYESRNNLLQYLTKNKIKTVYYFSKPFFLCYFQKYLF